MDRLDCSAAHEMLSARLDGDESVLDAARVDAHLAGCVRCRAYAARLARLHRAVRVRAAEPVPDLSEAILARARPARTADWARAALLVVALTELVLALPRILLGEEAGASAHIARHLGVLSAALAVGLIVAAWRPQRARALLPVALAVVAGTVATTALDVADGNVGALGEAHHVLELVALVLLWWVADHPPPRSRVLAAAR